MSDRSNALGNGNDDTNGQDMGLDGADGIPPEDRSQKQSAYGGS